LSFQPKASTAAVAANKEPQSCSNFLMEYLILKRDTGKSGGESLGSVEKAVGQPFFPELMPDGYTGSSAFAILRAPSSFSRFPKHRGTQRQRNVHWDKKGLT